MYLIKSWTFLEILRIAALLAFPTEVSERLSPVWAALFFNKFFPHIRIKAANVSQKIQNGQKFVFGRFR